MVAVRQPARRVGLRGTLPQQQCPPMGAGCSQLMQALDGAGGVLVGSGVLHGPPAIVHEGLLVLLSVVQPHQQSPAAKFQQGALIEYGLPDVRHVAVGIEPHHVAPSEVHHRLVGLVAGLQLNEVVAVLSCRLAASLDGQARVDVAQLTLLGQRHVPQVGSGSPCAARRFTRANLLGQLLAVDEGEHALIIGPLQGRQLCHLVSKPYKGRLHVAVVEGVLLGIGEHHLWRDAVQYAPCPLTGHVVVGGHNLVAQPDGLGKQFAVEVDVEKSLAGRVSGVEQSYVSLVLAAAEVVAQHAIVKQQLHVVVLFVELRANR